MADEAYEHEAMVPGPAAVAVPTVRWQTVDGIMDCYGTTAVNAAPLTTAGLYAPGCQYILVASGASKAYLNVGTTAVPSWTLFGSVA